MKRIILIILITLLLFTQVVYVVSTNIIAQPNGWSNDIRLTFNSDLSINPAIAVNGNVVHIVYADEEGGGGTNRYLWYLKSVDAGKTWNDKIRLTNEPTLGEYPAIAVNDSNIHLIWYEVKDEKIHYINSTDNGVNWGDNKVITPTSYQEQPDIAVNGTNIHVVFFAREGGIDRLAYVNSTDNGITWNNIQNLNISGNIIDPHIAVNGNNIHIVWNDVWDIRYINSTDNGKTWSNIQNIASGGINSDIEVNDSKIHVLWPNMPLNEIHYINSTDNGITWNSDRIISVTTANLGGSLLAINKENLHMIWWDERDGNREIYYQNSSDNGLTWKNEIRLTYNVNMSMVGDVTVNGSIIHIVWMDNRDDNYEIYYKHYPVPFPPTNLTIDIWETNLTLNWTAPQNSQSPVDHYLIYRVTDPDTFTFSDSEIIYNSSGTGKDLLTTWNDTTALLDENNNYYYVVRTIDAEGWNDTNTNIVGKYVIPMKKGWNMISLPLAQKNTSISKVLQTIEGNYDSVWIYDSKENRWRSSTNDLTDINRTMGLWIHMKNKCDLSVVGAVPESTDIDLYEGWNLVGYPSLKTRNLNDALSGISWTTVWTYDVFDINDQWKVNNTSKPVGLNDLGEMKPGYGYWVYVTINDSWVRTRVGEDNKVVVWRVPGLEEKENQYGLYESIIENPIETEKENSNKVDIVPTKSINKNEECDMDVSLIPLVILFIMFFVEVKLLYKRKK